MNYIQHGDISIHPLKELPKNLKKLKHSGVFVVAIGEGSGHQHRVKTIEREDSFDIYQDNNGYYLSVKNPVEIDHFNINTGKKAEHNTAIIERGFYIIKHEERYNPFTKELEKVMD
jgi:hypothetical protein